MLLQILKAFLAGLCMAVPVGPVLLLVMQKTVYRGRWAGAGTGAGSAVIDTLYASIGLFTLTYLESFFMDHKAVIMSVGGLLVTLIGLRMMLKKAENVKDRTKRSRTTIAGYALQTAGCALSNPAAIVFAIAILGFFGLDSSSISIPVWLTILLIFCGEMSWWLFVSYALTHFKRFNNRTVEILSHIAGAGIMVFGIILIVKGLLLIL